MIDKFAICLFRHLACGVISRLTVRYVYPSAYDLSIDDIKDVAEDDYPGWTVSHIREHRWQEPTPPPVED